MLQQIVDLLNINIYWKDAQGKYLGCNLAQAQDINLSSPQDIIGKTIFDFEKIYGSEIVSKINNEDNNIMQSGVGKLYEEVRLIDNGQSKTYLTNKKPLINQKGIVEGLVGISFDISYEKENIGLKSKLTSLNKQSIITKSIGSAIAHEIRTPLASLDGCLEHLLNLINSNTEKETLIEHIYMMKNIIYQSNNIIEMILYNLKFNNLDKDKFENFSIKECFLDAINEYPYSNNIQDIVTFQNFSDFEVYAPKAIFKFVMFNIFKNSLYAMSDKPNKQIIISSEYLNNRNYIYIQDNGRGIDKSTIPLIFNEFYTTKPHNIGSGLGLFFCKNVLESIGGKIECESKKGKFTKIILQL